MTPYGKKLLLAKDAAEFKALLGISSEGIWDEFQTRWTGDAYLRETNTNNTGSKALYLNGVSLQTAAPLTFGYNPFTVSFWMYVVTATQLGFIFRALGQTSSFAIRRNSVANVGGWLNVLSTGVTSMTADKAYWGKSEVDFSGKWQFCEISYNGSGTLSAKIAGVKKSVSFNIDREPRRIILGPFNGYIDELEILDDGAYVSYLKFED